MPASVLDVRRADWTREAEQRFVEEGYSYILENYELFDGRQIYRKNKTRAEVTVSRTLALLMEQGFGPDHVMEYSPIQLRPEDFARYQPIVDVLVLSKSFRYFRVDPVPSDIRLAIEIAGTSLAFDLGEKAEAYGRAGIPEYWVADVKTMTLTVHRRPNRVAGYDEVRKLSHDEVVFPLALPALSIPVSTVFLHLR